jgi:hypothetical protein
MFSTLKKYFYFVLAITIASCGSQKEKSKSTAVNTYPNWKYKKSRKSLHGTLDSQQYLDTKAALEKELNVKIPAGKSIMIHFDQKAPNCINVRFNDDQNSKIIGRGHSLSDEESVKYNVEQFSVYTADSFFAKKFEANKKFRLDTGYFSTNIFTLQENCAAFYILKPNGKHITYYGEDYFSEVKDFFEKK